MIRLQIDSRVSKDTNFAVSDPQACTCWGVGSVTCNGDVKFTFWAVLFKASWLKRSSRTLLNTTRLLEELESLRWAKGNHHSTKKEVPQNCVFCSDLDGPRVCHTERSHKEKNQHWILTHICGIERNGTDDLICKAKIETQTERTNAWLPWGMEGVGWTGGLDWLYILLTPCIK